MHGYNFGEVPVRVAQTQTRYPVRLKAAGYLTGFFGRFGVSFAPPGLKEQFDFFREIGRNPICTRCPTVHSAMRRIYAQMPPSNLSAPIRRISRSAFRSVSTPPTRRVTIPPRLPLSEADNNTADGLRDLGIVQKW